MIKNFLNLEGCQNPISGFKVTPILLLYCSTAQLLYRCNAEQLYISTAVLHYISTALQHYSSTAVLQHCITAVQQYYTTSEQQCSAAKVVKRAVGISTQCLVSRLYTPLYLEAQRALHTAHTRVKRPLYIMQFFCRWRRVAANKLQTFAFLNWLIGSEITTT